MCMKRLSKFDYLDMIDELILTSSLDEAWMDTVNYAPLFRGLTAREAIEEDITSAEEVYRYLYFNLYAG